MNIANRIQFFCIAVIVLSIVAGCAPATVMAPAKSADIIQTETTKGVNNNVVPADVRRQTLTSLFERACIERTTFTKYDKIVLRWPDDMTVSGEVAFRIMASGRIYGERHAPVSAGSVIDLGNAYVLPQGLYEVVLMPMPGEYHVEGLNIERRIGIEVWPQQDEPIQAASSCW